MTKRIAFVGAGALGAFACAAGDASCRAEISTP
jgi:hypothetical protein